ncbi:hypothetical protein [Spirosoma fluminis]
MKKVFAFVSLLILVSGACRDNSISSTSALYHRWQLVQKQIGKKAPEAVTKTTYITFTANGQIRFEDTGSDGSCCIPRRFTRNEKTLSLDYVTDQPEFCKYVDLACYYDYLGVAQWSIERVDKDTLLLRTSDNLLLHKRAD